MSLRALLLSLTLLLPAPAARAGELRHYALDPVHTRVMVAVDHAGLSRAIGTVSGSTGVVRFRSAGDGIDWRDATLDVRVPLARLDFGDARINKAVLAPGLLDAGRHPEARFAASEIEARDERHARVCGDLTLRGVTRPLCLEVTVNAVRRHPLPPFRRTAGFSATAQLDRTAFGITAWPNVIGRAIELRIEAEAVLDRKADEGEAHP